VTGENAGPSRRIVLATRNPGKLAELARILAASGTEVALATLDEFPGAPDVAETGRTFAENALLKARSAARFTGLAAVADDSGLCVDALNGMPGVLSARWAGRHRDDQANLALVLAQLADVPDPDRAAHFSCAAALVLPSGDERVVEGRLYGRLAHAPRGTNGFGYDPIFLPDAAELTTAEMEPAAKDAISHRGRALRALAPVIADLVPGEREHADPLAPTRWRRTEAPD
jgi:XTP/dITP diphosphohydrolase